MIFKDFEYASQEACFVVDNVVYSTNMVDLDHIKERANLLFSEEAKQEAKKQKTKLEESIKCEVADGDFKTFAEFDGHMYMFLVNSAEGVSHCIKVNKKRPPKFKGAACNIQEEIHLFKPLVLDTLE